MVIYYGLMSQKELENYQSQKKAFCPYTKLCINKEQRYQSDSNRIQCITVIS